MEILMFCALEPVRAVRAERLHRPVHLLATGVDGILPSAHQGAVSEPVRREAGRYVRRYYGPGAG